MPRPTPGGVPVMMMSPGSITKNWEQYQTRCSHEDHGFRVAPLPLLAVDVEPHVQILRALTSPLLLCHWPFIDALKPGAVFASGLSTFWNLSAHHGKVIAGSCALQPSKARRAKFSASLRTTAFVHFRLTAHQCAICAMSSGCSVRGHVRKLVSQSHSRASSLLRRSGR